MTAFPNLSGDAVQGNRIMVIGQDVAMVQRVSRYCLDQGAEVFPYYGTPNREEMVLFDPEVSVLCLPIPTNFLHQLDHPYIFWAEKPRDMEQDSISTWQELEWRLKTVLSLENSYKSVRDGCEFGLEPH